MESSEGSQEFVSVRSELLQRETNNRGQNTTSFLLAVKKCNDAHLYS